jgi:hypothetical protein
MATIPPAAPATAWITESLIVFREGSKEAKDFQDGVVELVLMAKPRSHSKGDRNKRMPRFIQSHAGRNECDK